MESANTKNQFDSPGTVRLVVSLFVLMLAGCSIHQDRVPPPAPLRACGVELHSIRITAAGGFLDLRFKVLEPSEAKILLDPSVPATLVHEPTGKVLAVASSKIGRLRQRAVLPEPGREYFILFRNSGGLVNPGEKVSLKVGSCEVEGLEVQ